MWRSRGTCKGMIGDVRGCKLVASCGVGEVHVRGCKGNKLVARVEERHVVMVRLGLGSWKQPVWRRRGTLLGLVEEERHPAGVAIADQVHQAAPVAHLWHAHEYVHVHVHVHADTHVRQLQLPTCGAGACT